MATYAIKWLKNKLGTRFFPVTHINAVRDDTGTSLASMLEAKQDTLVSGTNIKTLNNTSLLGSGNISLTGAPAIIEMRAVNISGNLENFSFVNAGEAYNIVVANGYNVVVRIDVGYLEDNEPTYYGEYVYMPLCNYYHGEGEYYLSFSYSDSSSLRSLYLSNDYEGGTDTLVIQGYDTNGFPVEIEIYENINSTTQPFQYSFASRYDAYYSYIGRNGNVKFVVKRGTRNAQNLFVPNGDIYPLEITYTGETDDKIVCSTYSSEKKLTFVFGIDRTNNQLTIDAINIETIPTESTVSDWGFTKNAGTITGINMNGASKGTSGVVNLGTVITEHQDISGKADKSTTTTAGTYKSVTVNDSGIVTGGTNPTTLAGYGITDAASSSDLANYLPLAGGTMSGTIKLPAGTGIEYSTGAGLLAYHPTNWGGTTNTQWCVGSLDSQGVIRSSNANLLHYNDGDGQSYAILDAKNYSSYALPLTGGTLTGDVVTTGEIMLYNNKYIRAKNTNDTNLNVLGIDTNNNLLVGYGNTASPTYIYGNSVRLLYGASRTIGITLDASGNTIFGSHIYLANNKYLYIGDGSGNNRNALYCSTAGNMFLGYDIAAAGKSTYIDGNAIYFRYGTSHGTAAYINASGNVGIGTTSPSTKLHVSGVVKCTSVDTSSDERMKNKEGDITIKVEDIANAPNVTFKWKDGEDTDNIHGGTYAQYWEKITPYYVHGDEEKSMDYASLSLSCAIELAKEVVQLKEENAQLKREIAEIKEMLKRVL